MEELEKAITAKVELFIGIQRNESLLKNRFFFLLLAPSPNALLS